MTTIGTWNIRGLNSLHKQQKIQQWVIKNRMNLFGILEPQVKLENLGSVEAGLGLQNWHFFSNGPIRSLCRIIVGWNPQMLTATMVHSGEQWVTCDIVVNGGTMPFRITFVYGCNQPSERQPLWRYLSGQKLLNGPLPWVVLGDFNAIMGAMDRQGGDTHWHRHIEDFPNCIHQSELSQISPKGQHLTWHNGQ
ncbi:hypothetical protein OIU85_001604 [Salix viminalis]|uniref:Endonuclease/exonuclease/phosphatase domain-containing protein n=1 Tax=Salix viminalis TaxID=40686 RepID=A0A9Q0ZXY8_SALVM|nr:hypothetical protein OIU85_001604 [Salix viminalis]